MDIDLILTIGHHLLVFSLVAIVAAEFAIIRLTLSASEIGVLSNLDRAYGVIAGLVIVIGFSRVYWGAKGPDYFLQNPVFHTKMAAFVLLGILSIYPTVRIIAWRRSLKANPAFSPLEREVIALRRYVIGEFLLVPVMLVCAAARVRGYGL